ncbi:Uncharacterised protein g10813 [Pycnogonum litorale]
MADRRCQEQGGMLPSCQTEEEANLIKDIWRTGSSIIGINDYVGFWENSDGTPRDTKNGYHDFSRKWPSIKRNQHVSNRVSRWSSDWDVSSDPQAFNCEHREGHQISVYSSLNGSEHNMNVTEFDMLRSKSNNRFELNVDPESIDVVDSISVELKWANTEWKQPKRHVTICYEMRHKLSRSV